jgi:lysophospholipid acyltransferase (LPLAT)-like uncharacterized protein
MSPGKKNNPFRRWRKKQAYNVLPVFPPVLRALSALVGSTARISSSGEAPALEMVAQGRPFLLAFFHGRLFLLMHHLKDYPLTVMVGISYIGEIQSRTLLAQGYETVSGSRTRGAARALTRLMKAVRDGRVGAFAVDGPRGPYGEVKEGVVYTSKKLGVPIIPVMTSARPSLVFRSSWDRFLLPLPFSRAVVRFGDPVVLDRNMDEQTVRNDCERLAEILKKLESEADAEVGKRQE